MEYIDKPARGASHHANHGASHGADHGAKISVIVGAWCSMGLFGACAAERTVQQPPDYPRSQEVLCHYVGLEAVTTPTQTDEDSVSMLAVYRFSEPNLPPPKERLALKFQVNRSRVDELRNHLESQPEVICTPDTQAHHQLRVKPFVAGGANASAASAPNAPASAAPATNTPPPSAAAETAHAGESTAH